MSLKDDNHITSINKDETVVPNTYEAVCTCGWKSGGYLVHKIALSASNTHRTIKKGINITS